MLPVGENIVRHGLRLRRKLRSPIDGDHFRLAAALPHHGKLLAALGGLMEVTLGRAQWLRPRPCVSALC
jgi:hypothetical protein